MEDRKSYCVDSDSFVNERSDNGASEVKEGKNPPHVTLHEKEIIEKDENGQLLRRTKQPEGLESVHNYAKRIKSFLGWEPLSDELEKERIGSAADRINTADLDHVDRDGKDGYSEKKDSLEESHACEDLTRDDLEGASDSVEKYDLKTTEYFDYKSESAGPYDLISETKETHEQEHCREIDNSLDFFYDNGDLIDNPSERDSNLAEKGEEILKTENLNTSEKNIRENSGGAIEVGLEKKSDLVSNGSENKENLTENSEKLADETFEEASYRNTNTTSENYLEISGIDEIVNPCLISNLKSENFTSLSEDKHLFLDMENSVASEIEGKDRVSISETNENMDLKPGDMSKTNAGNDIEVSKNITQSVDPSMGNTSIKESQSEDTVSLKSLEKQIESDDKQDRFEDCEEDLKSKDAIEQDDNISLKDNPYMAEIRRLSIGIVKEVIESARNSVHEIIVNKYEVPREENDKEGQENSANNNQININGESHFHNGNKFEEVTKESKDNVKNSEYTSNGNNDLPESKDVDCQKDSIVDDIPVCGLGCFKPRWIQQYSRPKVFLMLFSIIGVIHGCYYSYFVSIISTLEKRYAFKTKVSGTLLLADEITPLILGIIVGYIGSRTHRPRMVAIGMFMSAACCFISGLPYLIYGPAKHLSSISFKNKTGPEYCDAETETGGCDADDAPPTLTVVGIFLLASFLKGFATLSYYVIGIPYMDDNIKKKNSPLYLAIALALRLVGPLVGFLMSSAFLKLYENPADNPGYGPDDPRWVGAWWIGFFLQGILLVIFTLPIALFPRRLPGQRSVERNTAPDDEGGLKQIFTGLFSALKRLAKNRVFVLLIVNTNMKIFGHFGHSIMLPKYMENQFRLSASEASLYSGATSITFVMLSTIFGGYMIWKFRPRIKMLLGGMIISEVMLTVGFLILIIPRCQYADMMNFGMNDEGLILDSPCNQMCDCSTTSYTPFCGPQGTTYFSPCYAGCTQKLTSNMSTAQHKEFGNCSCVLTTEHPYLTPTISEGVCPDENCWSQALAYLIIYFILLTISNTFTVAHSMILLRSVHPNDKSIALGTFETFICLFGFIPFPVTFGALVDSACLVWEKSCGETGNCWFYNMEKYSYLLHGVGALFCSFSVLCLIGLYFLSGTVRDLYADEEDGKNDYVDIKLDTVSGLVTKL